MKKSPVSLLQATFEHIYATRMADVPICNTALNVETVGFTEWEGRWVGVLITPWMMNLVLLASADAPLQTLALGEVVTWPFPSGSYEFMGCNEGDFGACHTCSLISPMDEFATHEAARAVAQEVMENLLTAPQTDQASDAALAEKIEAARLQGESIANQAISRRDFLRMRLFG